MDLPPQLWNLVLRHLGSNDAACLAAAADPLSDLVCHALARRMGLGDWLLEAAEDARPEACRWLADHAPLPLPDPGQAFAAAATRGRLAVCQFLAAHFGLDTAHLPGLVEEAARGGHVAVCQWLVSTLSDTGREGLFQTHGGSFLRAAAEGGAAAACLWLVGAAPLSRPDGAKALLAAIRGGHLDVCVWLKANFRLTPADMDGFTGEDCTSALRKAAARGHLHVWRWLEDDMGMPRPPTARGVLRAAAQHGHLDMIRHLVDGPEAGLLFADALWPMLYAASANGFLDVCRWALQRYLDLNPRAILYVPVACCDCVFERACRHGPVAQCEWLARHLQVMPFFRPEALHAAAAGGRLDVCQFLVSHFRFHPSALRDALFRAAGQGRLRVCRWLVLSGLVVLDQWTWRRTLWTAVTGGGHMPVFRWVARRVYKTKADQ